MVQVELARIIIDDKGDDQAVVLREKDGGRQIPILIGYVEAHSIQMRISGMTAPRPLTHDLIVNVIASLNARAEQVYIDDLVEGTYFAKLRLIHAHGTVDVDCRPSDGIALSVRMGIPLFVDEKVFQKAVSNGI
jgi:bifunctional DNase/RNase